MRRIRFAVLAFLILPACGGNGSGGHDGGGDAAKQDGGKQEAAGDKPADATGDGGATEGGDGTGGSDASGDGKPDAGPDAAGDAASDAKLDAPPTDTPADVTADAPADSAAEPVADAAPEPAVEPPPVDAAPDVAVDLEPDLPDDTTPTDVPDDTAGEVALDAPDDLAPDLAPDAAPDGPADTTPEAPPADGGACPAPVASAPAVTLADFEDGTIPTSDSDPEGFRGSDVARGTIAMPGANGSSKAVTFDFGSDSSVFFQGDMRPQYLDGDSTYKPDLGNALEMYLRIPAGSSILADSGGATFSVFTYHWKPGDPWVGPNGTGGNLTDSQMHGYGSMRFSTSAGDKWIRVVMGTAAFEHSRGNYHFYAARGVVEDLTFFGSLRQFQPTVFAPLAAPATIGFDEMRLVTLPPTAAVCPPHFAMDVPADGGDVSVPIQILNPTGSMRSYRVFLSSVIGVDRQTLEVGMHDADDVGTIDDFQSAVDSDGGMNAVELFADDGTGLPTGASIIPAGAEITIAAGATWKGVLVHHVTAGMLGPVTPVMSAGMTYMIRRDTLTTSAIVWDPAEPRLSDAAVVFTGSNADTSHPAPPGFPAQTLPPTGWASSDVASDQAVGTFVSILRLLP